MPRIFLIINIFLFILGCIQPQGVNAQNKNNWTELGDKAFNRGDFYGASIYYDYARIKTPTDLPLIYKLAEALRLNSAYKKAEDYYKYVAAKDETQKYPLASFWQASMEKYNGKYSTSILSWSNVKQQFSNDTSSYEYRKAQQEIISCDFANRYAKKYQPIEVTNIGKSINTTEAEFGTWLQHDSLLFFSSLRGVLNENNEVISKEDYFIKVYLATLEKGVWKNNGALDSVINHPNYHTGNGSFSKDNQRFYFSRCDLNLKCNLYQTQINNNQWKPAQLISELNTEFDTSTQPIVTELNGVEVLFFVSDRKGGYGGNDIWYALKQNDSTYTEPINVGPEINTLGNEISPFYDNFDSTFYFSSDWHSGFGGFDVFKTTLDLNNPMTIENMEQPINTSVNDFYFSIFKSKGFLTSNRPGSYVSKGLTCCNDLYEVSFTDRKEAFFLENNNYGIQNSSQIKVEISDVDKLNNLLPLSLYFNNDYPDPKTMYDTTVYAFDSLLIDYKKYKKLFVKKAGKGYRGDKKRSVRNEMTHFFESKVEESEEKINQFLTLLQNVLSDGKKLNITVRGYASPLADSEYNFQLTKRRIVSFNNLLVEYENGYFKSYINKQAENGGVLKISSLPFGEIMSLQTVSDELDDRTNSVYSAEASLERKIDIVAVTTINKEKLLPKLKFDNLTKDFESIKQGTEIEVGYSFTNIGNAPLVIKSLETSCGCTVPKLQQTVYQPGERGVLKVVFNSEHKIGRQFKTVSITTNGQLETIKLSLIGLVTIP